MGNAGGLGNGVNSALMIADYIISKGKGKLAPLQVIKLVYISHGYTLALVDKPLIGDRIEAWKYGPVVPVLYHALKHYGRNCISQLYYSGTGLADEGIKDCEDYLDEAIASKDRTVVDRVMEVYGSFTSSQLSNLTHEKGTPWAKCYVKGQLFTEIPNYIIKEHYTEICESRP